MSVYAFGSNIIYGTSTLPISAVMSAIPNTSLYTLEASAMIISSQTLVLSGEAVTFGFDSGETVRIMSWGAGGFSLAVVSKGPGGVRTTTEEAEGAFITRRLEGNRKRNGSGTATKVPSVQMYIGILSRAHRDTKAETTTKKTTTNSPRNIQRDSSSRAADPSVNQSTELDVRVSISTTQNSNFST
jgi:hypothetical protein